jgi:hypothetical protein
MTDRLFDDEVKISLVGPAKGLPAAVGDQT